MARVIIEKVGGRVSPRVTARLKLTYLNFVPFYSLLSLFLIITLLNSAGGREHHVRSVPGVRPARAVSPELTVFGHVTVSARFADALTHRLTLKPSLFLKPQHRRLADARQRAPQ